jgi:hypothetical protein
MEMKYGIQAKAETQPAIIPSFIKQLKFYFLKNRLMGIIARVPFIVQ